MRIKPNDLFRLVPSAKKKVSGGAAVRIIWDRYCSKITVAGYCDSACETTCGPTLQDIFKQVNQAPDAKSHAGLLTWISRVKAADLVETFVEATKAAPTAQKDGWGLTVKGEEKETPTLEDILG